MFILGKRIGAALMGLALVTLAGGDALGQFRQGPNQPAGGGGGVGMARPVGGVGFGGGLAGLPAGNFGTISSNPLSTVGSSPYSPGLGGDPFGGYGYFNASDPYGGYLKGAASVISAQGQQAVAFQQAFQIKEDTRRTQIENRRRVFDEWLYERANTPSLQDEIERTAKMELRRSRIGQDKNDIWSGRALNILLENLIRTDRAKASGGSAPIDESILKRINLTSGKGNINLGVLKNDGKLEWPIALRSGSMGQEGRELRQQLQTLVKKAYDEAKGGAQADPGTLKDIRDGTARLQQLMNKNGEAGFNEFVEANRFVNGLREGLNLLQQPNAADFINGKYNLGSLKGNTVADVVDYMRDNGLLFAPAVEGEQAAYLAVHRALANYDVAASSLTAEK